MTMPVRVCLVAAALLSPTAAHASDHLMRVNEVMVNDGLGDEFVELHDPVAEAFPNGPYRLEVFDTNGSLVQAIPLPGIAGGTDVYYVVGNAAAQSHFPGVSFDGTLTAGMTIPGQACFVRADGSKAHCMAWGCVKTLVDVDATITEYPPYGGSVSLQPDGSVHVTGTPTPGAANGAMIALGPMCTDADAGSPTPDGGADAADAAPPPTDGAVDAVPPATDASDAGDGGDSGCGCSTGAPGGMGGPAVLLLTAALLARRRRGSPHRWKAQ